MRALGTIAISISSPPDGELAARGLNLDHVRHAYVELARQILAGGGSLAYGGNPLSADPNYFQVLLALLHTYSMHDRPSRTRIRNYVAAHLWSEMTATARADIAGFMTLVRVPPAAADADRAANYTAMREAMTANSDARIILGGRLEEFSGRWPGVVEEAYLTLKAGRPLDVAGGLGGAASVVADLLRERDRPDIKLAVTQELRDTFAGVDLRNGLTAEENELLHSTTDLDLMTALILRGLHSLKASDETDTRTGA
jgi:hypothetical protein